MLRKVFKYKVTINLPLVRISPRPFLGPALWPDLALLSGLQTPKSH